MLHIDTTQTQQAKTLLDGAQNIVIAITAQPTIDTMAASLSFYLALSAAGKNATIVCASPMIVEFSNLIAIDKVGNSIKSGDGKNLVIAFPYQEGSIEKVSYNIENDTFHLVIEPREGFPKVTPDMIRYSSGSDTADLLLIIGAQKLEDLGPLYQPQDGLFAEKPIISLDNGQSHTHFGKANLVDHTASALSEMTVFLLSTFGLPMDTDIATNLLAGIMDGSKNFTSPNTSASTFEAAAVCAKHTTKSTPPSSPGYPQKFPPFPGRTPSQKFSPPTFPSFPQQPTPFQSRPSPIMGKPPMSTSPLSKPSTSHAPPDWLKPKIYKGSSIV